MENQLTFADSEYSQKRRLTRKEKFLGRMEKLVPWIQIIDLIEPFYAKAGNGRRPYPLETMLRIHCLQQWYSLSDESMEDALYETMSMQRFARLSLTSGIPDRTTIMNFRHLLERHQLGRQIFDNINEWLSNAGVITTQGTIVDATIIDAPTSTKNRQKQRDPEMHSTKKGNQWYFGMKAHIGVDMNNGLTHSLVTTAANAHDVTQVQLLHGQEEGVMGDAGYLGAEKREETQGVKAEWIISERPGTVKKLRQDPRRNKSAINFEKMKAKVRAKVEHPFRIIKCQFGFTKTRYKGLAKNDNQLAILFTLANVVKIDQMIRGTEAKRLKYGNNPKIWLICINFNSSVRDQVFMKVFAGSLVIPALMDFFRESLHKNWRKILILRQFLLARIDLTANDGVFMHNTVDQKIPSDFASRSKLFAALSFFVIKII